MPDSSSPTTAITSQLLDQVRAFIRDVGTPITILLFVGLIYTGYLHSPITDLVDESKTILAQHQSMLAEIHQERSALWALYGVTRSMCRHQENLTESQKDDCDKMTSPPSPQPEQ